MNILIENWPLALIAIAVALVLLYLLLRPRQRVTLTDSAPLRPHMAPPAANTERAANRVAEIAASATHSILSAREDRPLAPPSGPPDDLVKLKGIGPKLAALLNQHGITRFDQLATLTLGQVDNLDDSLGAFRGRLARDHVVDQADYLARGDIDGFEQRFGKL